jgi:hypothetical protein
MYELPDVSRTLVCVFDVERRAVQPIRVVAELPEATVAVEAKDAANAARGVIVVDMLGTWFPAYRTDVTLLAYKLVELCGADAVAALQVVVARPSVETFLRLFATRVVTGLAVGVSTVSRAAITGKLREWLVSSAVRTALHAQIVR